MVCKICKADSRKVFSKVVLGRHHVDYHLCASCGFLQTDEPFWLDEAYASALSIFDTALVARPLGFRAPICRLIQKHLDPNGRFLDFGGGAGLFARMMRDLGYDFYWDDKYAENVFAKGFDLNSLQPENRRFSLVTAFEVMEHVPDPMPVFHQLTEQGGNFLFSTELQPEDGFPLANWAYLGEQHGQHVSFYTVNALKYVASKLGLHYHRCGKYLHLYSTNPIRVDLDPNPLWQRWPLQKLSGLWNLLTRCDRYWLTRRSPVQAGQPATDRR